LPTAAAPVKEEFANLLRADLNPKHRDHTPFAARSFNSPLSHEDKLIDDSDMGFWKRANAVVFAALSFSMVSNGISGVDSNVTATSAAGPSASQTLASFRLKPGFRLQLIASEPMVVAPVAIAFDENGRLFVVERQDSASDNAAGAHPGRVRVLENPDTNGMYQTSSIYTDNLLWPSAVACYAGGVFVAAVPDLIYLKDTKNDGAADVKQVVLTGFGGTNSPSADALPNSFAWGLDNRIHGVTAGIDGLILASNWPSGPVSLTGSDFALEPRTLEIMAETGPAQSGLTFDSRGQRYVSDFSRPLRMPMYEQRYVTRNPFYAKPAGIVDVLSPASTVFHLVPYLGPHAHSSSLVDVPPVRVGTNVLEATWLASARGCVIYRGGAFPTNYLETAFLADAEHHVVHHTLLRENGLQMTAERAPDERTQEFLISSDPWFRPVQLLNGPEGALYIVDAQDGNQRGRIYRVVPNNFKGSKPVELGKAKTYDLIRSLAEGDGWHRDTAARLLYERRDPAAVPLLAGVINRSRLPLARVYALHALDGMEALQEEHVLRALSDTDALVREHGVLLSERIAKNGVVSDTLWNQLTSLAVDPSIRVRYQLAFTLGSIQRMNRALALRAILNRDLNNAWIRGAVLSSLAERPGSMFVLLAGDSRFRNDATGLGFMRQLATMIGAQGQADEVAQLIDFVTRDQLSPGQSFAILYSLAQGLHQTKSSLVLVDPQQRLQRWYAAAFNVALDLSSLDPARVEALHLLGFSTYRFSELSDWLLLMCTPPPAPTIQNAAVDTLCRFEDPLVLQGLLDRWQGLTPTVRNHALTTLLANDRRVAAVLDALAMRRIPVTDLSDWQLNFLRTHRDPSISARAIQLFGPVPVRRPAVQNQFRAALGLQGSAERGRGIFTARCAECHQPGSDGMAFGPDLRAARAIGKEQILDAILEPSQNVAPEYATWVVETKDGETLIGIKADDDLPTITLRQPGGVQLVWPRLNVRSAQTPNWSLMPSGLEQGLSAQDMADLLEYVIAGLK